MGFAEILTIIFVILKIFGRVDWSWVVVFLPEIIAVTFYAAYVLVVGFHVKKTRKHMDRIFDDLK